VDFSAPAAPADPGQGFGLLGMNFPTSSSAPSDASSLQGLSFSSTAEPAAAAAPENAGSTPGDRLRQALLNGTGSELSSLFEQSRRPQDVPVADRFASLQGNLSGLFSSSQHMMQGGSSAAFAMPPMTMSQPTMQPLGGMLALPPVSHTNSMQPLNNCLALMPPSGPGMGSFQSSNTNWWAATPQQQQGAGGYLPSPSLAPTAFAPPMGGPTSTPFPQFSGPPHAGFKQPNSPNGSARMSSGFSGFGSQQPPSPNGNARMSSGFGGFGSHQVGSPPKAAPTSPSQSGSTEDHQSPPKDGFGDLLAAFHEKNPINGLEQNGLRILA